MAADEGLGVMLPQQPSGACLALLKANLPAQGTVNTPACQPTPLIHVSCCRITGSVTSGRSGTIFSRTILGLQTSVGQFKELKTSLSGKTRLAMRAP